MLTRHIRLRNCFFEQLRELIHNVKQCEAQAQRLAPWRLRQTPAMRTYSRRRVYFAPDRLPLAPVNGTLSDPSLPVT